MQHTRPSDHLLDLYVRARTALALGVRDQRGEGVISAAIAVLVMAALGAIMWIGFQQIWQGASSQTTDQISSIGG